MDNKRSILNVSVSIAFKILILIGSLFVRRCLIKFVGNETNGINSLYISIIGVLSVAELGIGGAIIYCMYKPIVEGDVNKVSALYVLFKKVYIVIGLIIAVAGCAIMPFLPYLAKGYDSFNINLYLTFSLMLVSVVITYFFSAKTSLMDAYRDNYITTTITSSGHLLQLALQLLVLFLTRSFVWYLICRIIAALLQLVITDVITKKRYSFVINNVASKIDKETKSELVKNVKAMFMHRIGGVLVNTIDSIIISAFIGVVILGKYSNYTIIMTSMTGVITLFFTPLISTIGHVFASNSNSAKKYFNFFYAFNFVLGCLFFLGYYSIIDALITILFGDGLLLTKQISFVITVNYFVQFMRQSVLLFRDATGTFYYDRWKPLAEGLTNLILSIAFVLLFKKIMGEDFAVVGVIVATILTNIFICHIVEPFVLHKHAFEISTKKFFFKNYGCIALFVVLLLLLNFCMINMENLFLEIIINGGIAIGLSLIVTIVMFAVDKDFRHYIKRIFSKLCKS